MLYFRIGIDKAPYFGLELAYLLSIFTLGLGYYYGHDTYFLYIYLLSKIYKL